MAKWKRTCKNPDCRARFLPERPDQKACCPDCAVVVGRAERIRKNAKAAASAARKERAEDKAKREAMMTLPQLLGWAQKAVNKWVVHVRDKENPCFSCNEYKESYDAGHYIAVGRGRTAKRFVENNIHKQCVQCNQHLHGNLLAYREAMVWQYGETYVKFLEREWPPHHPTRDEIRAIGEKYRALLRDAGVKL